MSNFLLFPHPVPQSLTHHRWIAKHALLGVACLKALSSVTRHIYNNLRFNTRKFRCKDNIFFLINIIIVQKIQINNRAESNEVNPKSFLPNFWGSLQVCPIIIKTC